MSQPTLLRFDGQTYIRPSFCRIEVDGYLYLLDAEEKTALIDLDKRQGPNVAWEDTCRLFVTIRHLRPVTAEEADRRADWELIIAVLHPTASRNNYWLNQSQKNQVRWLGDGFGDLVKMLEEGCEGDLIATMLYDWSHVRDSSPAAIQAMAQKIRDLVARQ